MPRRAATPTTAVAPIVDPQAPFDGPDDDDVVDPTSVEIVIPDVFSVNTATANTGVSKRSVSVTVRHHIGTDKNAGPLSNTTVEITLAEEGPLDFDRALKTAQVFSNEIHDMIGNALGVDTVEADGGWVMFAAGRPSPFPQQAVVSPAYQPQVQAPAGGYAPQPQQYPQAPQGGQGGMQAPNYDAATKGALMGLYGQQPHLFQVGSPRDFGKGPKTPLTPTPAAFAAIGLPAPAGQIKSIWV